MLNLSISLQNSTQSTLPAKPGKYAFSKFADGSYEVWADGSFTTTEKE